MSREKFDAFLSKHMQVIVSLIILAIVIPAGYFLAVELVRTENLEITSLSYKEIKMMAEVQPEMIPLINNALSDGKISRREFNSLRRERFNMLNKTETEKNKADLINYLNE